MEYSLTNPLYVVCSNRLCLFILVLMEYSLTDAAVNAGQKYMNVLILVLMECSLTQECSRVQCCQSNCLNPYSNGILSD